MTRVRWGPGLKHPKTEFDKLTGSYIPAVPARPRRWLSPSFARVLQYFDQSWKLPNHAETQVIPASGGSPFSISILPDVPNAGLGDHGIASQNPAMIAVGTQEAVAYFGAFPQLAL